MNEKKQNDYCFLCDEEITLSNDSAEHIIPNAIGGRKTVSGFICLSCNNKCGSTWDAALAKQLDPISLYTRIKRQRGNPPAQVFKTANGQEVRLLPNGNLTYIKPKIDRTAKEKEVTEINIQANSRKQLKQVLDSIKKKHANIDVEQCIKEAKFQKSYTNDPLMISVSIGGPEGGRSIIKSIVSLAKKYNINIAECNNAKSYLQDECADPCFGYYYENDLILNRPDDKIFHCIGISNKSSSNLLLGYVEFFSTWRIVACLSDSYKGENIHEAYALDPISGSEIDLNFAIPLSKSDINKAYDYQKIPEGSLEQAMSHMISLIHKQHFEEQRNKIFGEAYTEAMAQCELKDDTVLSEEQAHKFSRILLEKCVPSLLQNSNFCKKMFDN